MKDGNNVGMKDGNAVQMCNTSQWENQRFTLEHDVENDNWFFVSVQNGHVWNCAPDNGYSHAPNKNRLAHEAMKIEIVQNPA